MAESTRWALVALAVSCCLAAVTAAPGSSRQLLQLQEDAALQIQPELSPEAAAAEESDETPLDREKRKILELKLGAGFGVKHFLLDLIFGRGGIGRGIPVPPPPPTTTTTTTTRRPQDEIPEFPRTRVSLMIPDELFADSFSLITNISKIAGSLVNNAADRKVQLVEAAKPFVAAKLGLDLNAPFSTTEPIEQLVPRLGPPLSGGSSNTTSTPSPSTSSSTSSSSPSSTSSSSVDESTTEDDYPMYDESANRIERSG